MIRNIIFIAFVAILGCEANDHSRGNEEETAEYWRNLSQDELALARSKENKIMKSAKNVIIFIGDGMDISTITSARILKGQLAGGSGENSKLTMDKFPNVGLSKTYSVNKQVSDSASTATAIMSGAKTNDFLLGLTGAARLGDCSTEAGNEVNSTLVEAWAKGKSTGVVTTTRIIHATPSSTYAHSVNRMWYSDAELPDDAKSGGCKDLAQQFYDSSNMITVAFGGGRAYMRPNTTTDVEYPDQVNKRLDGQDLIEMWMSENSDIERRKFVWNKEQFNNIDIDRTDRLLGLFQPSDMNYEADRPADGAGEPSIAEMTRTAIEMLQKNEKGFFLLVEGGRIDHAHHMGNAYRAMHDTLAFDDAIAMAKSMTSDEETLIIVTADHGHTISLGGYVPRGNPLFGTVPIGPWTNATDTKGFTSLLYANGPGFQGMESIDALKNGAQSLAREDADKMDTEHIDYLQQTAVPLTSETHGGADVMIAASGPMSHLFHGIHEQSYIAHVVRYAACIGDIEDYCLELENTANTNDDLTSFLGKMLTDSQVQLALYLQFVIILFLTIILILCIVFLCRRSERVLKSV